MSAAIANFPLRGTWERVARPSPAVRYGIKYGSAAAVSIWFSQAYNLPHNWPLITVMMICQPVSGGSIQKGLLRLSGTVVAAFLSIAVYGLVAQQPPLLLASICTIFAVGTYGMNGPRYQYAWNVFAFTTGIILADALQGTEQIEILAFERSGEVAIGLLIVFLADEIFWPVRSGDQLRAGLAQRCGQIAAALGPSFDAIASPPEAAAKSSPLPSSPLAQQLTLIDQLRSELGYQAGRAQAFTAAALQLEWLAARVRLIESTAPSGVPAPSLRTALEDLRQGLATALGETAQALLEQRAPRASAAVLEQSLAAFETERRAAIEARLQPLAAMSDAAPAVLSAIAPLLHDLVAGVGRLENTLTTWNDDKRSAQNEESRPAAAPRLRVDPIRLQTAIRAGIASGVALVGMMAVGWKVNTTAIIVAWQTASAPTRGAGMAVSVPLIGVVLCAWALADVVIVFVFPHLDVSLAFAVPFAIAGGLGYLAVQRPALAPIVPIGTLITLLSLYSGSAAPHDVAGPYDTTTYLVAGFVVGLVVQAAVFPRTASAAFLERAAGQLGLCGVELGHDGNEPGGDQGTATLVAAYGRQLAMLGQQHALAEREPVAQALDSSRRGALLALIQDLFDASLEARRLDRPPSQPGAEADILALRAAAQSLDDALESSTKNAVEALRGNLVEVDNRLEAAIGAFDARLDETRSRIDLARSAAVSAADKWVAVLARRRQLATRQLAIESWLVDWRTAAGESR